MITAHVHVPAVLPFILHQIPSIVLRLITSQKFETDALRLA